MQAHEDRRRGNIVVSRRAVLEENMGADPQASVADPRGELHDTKGVWVGDASAFPTAVGVNPMVSIMALAHRTADAMTAAPADARRETTAPPAPLATT